MVARSAAVFCLVFAFCCSLAEARIAQADDTFCRGLTGGGPKTLLFAADPGAYIGVGEAQYLLQNLQTPQNKSSDYCQSVVEGTIMGQAVLVIASGINAYNQQACISELLQCSRDIQDVIAFGTSGFSAKLGGVIDPTDCAQPTPGTDITRIGDLCITPFASNWACKLASWEEQCAGFPNVCSYPGSEYELTADFLFGQCTFAHLTKASLDLTLELQQGAMDAFYPARSAELMNHTETYWTQTQSQGTNALYEVNQLLPPTLYNYTQCGVTSAQFFWSGVPWDAVARNYTAQLINEALNTSLTQRDVIAVSEEEGNGLLQALQRYNELLEGGEMEIPYTIVRTNSDYVHVPVARAADGTWTDASPFLAPDFQLGFPYAIATASTAILQTLQNRCTNENGGNANTCPFTMSYAASSA